MFWKRKKTGARKIEGLALYQYAGCPFCLRVRHALRRLGIEIELRDTLAEAAYRDEVLEATGRGTVPVLRIEEEDGGVHWMPESADIVAYLQQRFS